MLEALWRESARARTLNCRRVVTGQLADVQGLFVRVDRAIDGGGAFVRGLQTCGHVTCPSCGPKIRRAEGERLQALVDAHLSTGGTAIMGVFTLSHGPFDRLADLLDGLEAGRRAALSGTWYRDRKRYGIVGNTWHLEVMFGLNGAHPHNHTLFLVDGELSDYELAEMETRLFGRYETALAKTGHRADARFNHLERVESGAKAARYVAKDVADEMTMGDAKAGKTSGLESPTAILYRFTETGDQADMNTFNEYERAMADNGRGKGRGRRWRQWSRGLAARYGVDDATEQADQAAADAEDTKGDTGSEPVLEIESVVWNEMTAQLGAVETLIALVEERQDVQAAAYVETFRQRLRDRGDLSPGYKGRGLVAPLDTGPGRIGMMHNE